MASEEVNDAEMRADMARVRKAGAAARDILDYLMEEEAILPALDVNQYETVLRRITETILVKTR